MPIVLVKPSSPSGWKQCCCPDGGVADIKVIKELRTMSPPNGTLLLGGDPFYSWGTLYRPQTYRLRLRILNLGSNTATGVVVKHLPDSNDGTYIFEKVTYLGGAYGLSGPVPWIPPWEQWTIANMPAGSEVQIDYLLDVCNFCAGGTNILRAEYPLDPNPSNDEYQLPKGFVFSGVGGCCYTPVWRPASPPAPVSPWTPFPYGPGSCNSPPTITLPTHIDIAILDCDNNYVDGFISFANSSGSVTTYPTGPTYANIFSPFGETWVNNYPQPGGDACRPCTHPVLGTNWQGRFMAT